MKTPRFEVVNADILVVWDNHTDKCAPGCEIFDSLEMAGRRCAILNALEDPDILKWYVEQLQSDADDMDTQEARDEVFRLWTQGCSPVSVEEAWERAEEVLQDAINENPGQDLDDIAADYFGSEPPQESLQFTLEVPRPEGVSIEEIKARLESALHGMDIPCEVSYNER